jgi:replicative DNA helicase
MVQSLDDARRQRTTGTRTPPHDLAAEESLLGAMLLSPNAIGAAAEVRLAPGDFYKPAHGHIYEAIETLYHRGEPADPVTVSDELHRAGLLEAIGGPPTLVSLQSGTPAISNAGRYAKIVEEFSLLRRLIGVAAEIADLGYSLPDDVSSVVDRAETLVFEVNQRRLSDDMMPVKDLLVSALDRLEALYERGEEVTGVPTGFNELDHTLSGLQPNNLVVVGARPAMGKAQPVDTPVLTPTGWRPIGDIRPGDLVVGADGGPTTVLAVHPQGVIPVYRVSLNDGTSTRACADHRWFVQSHIDRRAGRDGRVVTTKEILEGLNAGRSRDFHIPVVAPVRHPEIELPIPPYVLGLLLGDGGLTHCTPVITTADPEVITSIETALPFLKPSSNDRLSYRLGLGRSGGIINPLTAALRDLGLWGHKSESKFIPTPYLFAGVEQRLALLQGLMDSDGWCEKFNSLQFASASPSLANDVCVLVRSLGGTARLRVRHTTHLDSHTVTLRLPRDMCPFRLARKSCKWNGDGKWARPDRRIVAVAEDGEADSVCLTVVAADGLYVTEAHIVTHNTSFALGMLAHAAMEANVPSLLFSLEMGRDEITQRLLCSEARVDATKLRNGRFDDRDWQKVTAAVGRLAEAPIYIDDNPNVTVMDIRAKARRLKAREGLGLIIIDYLQLMSGRARAESRQVEVAEMSRNLKILARELQIPVVALSQLSRTLESRQDKRPMLSDLRESGCLTADSRVLRADTGAEVTMGSLLLSGERNIPVWSLDENLKMVAATMTHVFPSGTKETFALRLASGRVVEASANHPFRTLRGWTALDELEVGTRVASAETRVLEPAGQAVLRSEAGGGQPVGCKERPVTFWDSVVAIEPLGPKRVYDATVIGTHNFIANGICVHNSIEQDADVVMFLYRDEMYNSDSADKGVAEVIVAKHRSGPTGTTQLAFLPQYTRFSDMARTV